MGNYKEIDGNLITNALNGDFNVILQGNNCFCVQGAGIALQFIKHFKTDTFTMEQSGKGDINKLGQIDYELLYYSNWDKRFEKYPDEGDKILYNLYVVNCYTQYHWGTKFGIPVDYDAIRLCMRKINHTFKGKKIGMPTLGAGLAGGNWDIIKDIIITELVDCDVTVVIFKKD